MNNNTKLTSTAGLRILMLLILALGGLIVSSASVLFLDRLPKFDATLWLLVFQDIFVFIIPTILALLILYKRPLAQMSVDRAPSWRGIAAVACVYIVSLPALNWLVKWNESLHLPYALADLEMELRNAESAAGMVTQMLLAETSLLPMLFVVMVVGVMTGVSEECFFRGGMLRMFKNDGNSHWAVWTVAIIFSAMHMQFFGFFPRMVLGAWLGYLLVWTRSLWVPVIAHALNNSMVVIAAFLANVGIIPSGWLDKIGIPQDGSFPLLAVASAVATIALAVFFRGILVKEHLTHDASPDGH